MELPRPDPRLPHLADVAPSVLAAMGVGGFEPRILLTYDVAGACVLLIDGLGADLLDTYAADAPVLASLRGPTLQAGFPSTTAAGLAAVGTGCRSGEHGMVGMTFRLPDVGVVNALRWRPQPWGEDLRERVVPEDVQPRATIFERAASSGVAVSVVSGAQFAGSGLTRAVLRGGRYIGVHAIGDLGATIAAAVADRGFCYGYHADLDLVGHLYGPGSEAWRLQLRQVDRLVQSIVEGLPRGGLLAVVADHGMVAIDTAGAVDADATPALHDGVEAIGGEVRARHVYTRAGACEDVKAVWHEMFAATTWVATREEAIAAGWFGERVADEMRPRIGDLVVAARGSAGILRRTVEPVESSLIGQHGSLTDAELRIPLLLASA
jgi:hypothetical protein